MVTSSTRRRRKSGPSWKNSTVCGLSSPAPDLGAGPQASMRPRPIRETDEEDGRRGSEGLGAEELPLDARVAGELRRGAGQRHAAGLQDVGPVGERERVADVLFDQEDRHALLANPIQRGEDLP